MVASVRSVASNVLDFVAQGQVERGFAQAGDLLLAFHSCDEGTLSGMTMSGGWTLLTSLAGDEWAGTKVWRRIATASEPDVYDVHLPSNVSIATVIILALKGVESTGIIVAKDDSRFAPAATPDSASGVEIRYAAAGLAFTQVQWGRLSGYSGLDVQGGEVFTTASIAVRPYISSAAMPAVDMRPQPSNFPLHAFTIIVRATGAGGGSAPEPPHFPASTPGKGDSRLRYTVHDFLTGSYRADIFPSGVTLDKRIGEPGTWRGKLSIPNDAEGAKVNEIFPADPLDLTSGPGRLVVHTWRSGVLWGIHWIHGTTTQRDDRGNVVMDLQGSTLDGYLLHVTLEEDLSFGDDQIANARDLISDMQATAASNPGLGLMAGLSGVVRELLPTAASNSTYGRILQDFAKATDGFEWVVNPRVDSDVIIRSWEWGSPKIVGDMEHVFVEGVDGGTITSWREERSALRGGTRWGAIGGTPQQEDTTESATAVRAALVSTPHIAAGWPILDQRPTHPTQTTDQNTIDDYAKYWAQRAPGAPPVFSFDASIGPGSTIGPNSLGDNVRAILNNPRYPINADGSASFNRSQRLIGWSLTPAERREGKDRITLVTEAEGDD